MNGAIFLSYAGADRELATRLKDGLMLGGLEGRIWQDIDQIRGGDNWLLKLDDSLKASSAYLIVVGAGGIHKWVKFELYAAVRRHYDSDEHFPIFPILLPGATPDMLPSFLSTFQAETLPLQPAPADYQRLAERITLLLSATPPVEAPEAGASCDRSPWPGLAAYDESMVRFFFGRPTETLEALRLLGDARDGVYRRWLQVEGQSGVGKSSLVQAGLIPSIERGWFGEAEVQSPRPWRVAKMRPGSEPIAALAVALAGALEAWRKDPDTLKEKLQAGSAETLKLLVRVEAERATPKFRLLLVVDQLEELFAPLVPVEARSRFDALLANGLADPDGPLHLITTIRSDFTLHQQQQMPALCALINDRAARYVVGPIARAGLKEVVWNPARLAGLVWDEVTLPGRIVDDAEDTPNPLPLVSNLLWLLWQQRQGHRLLGSAYEALDGVGGALSKSAEALWKTLDEDSRTRARGLLLKLVSVGRDRADTRRTIARSVALQAAGGGERAEAVLQRLSGAVGPDANQGAGPRLVMVGGAAADEASGTADERVDLAHEALLTRWELLRGWLADADTRRQLEAEDALEEAARFWERDGQPEWPGLPDPRMLERYLKANAPSPLAHAYRAALERERGKIEAERLALGAEQHEAKRRLHRRLWIGGGALACVLSLYAGLDLWANANGASRGLAVRALGIRWGLSEPPPIPEMVEIQTGTFQMGSWDKDSAAENDEKPRHEVSVKAFKLGKYETTFAEYEAFATVVASGEYRCGDGHRAVPPGDENWGRDRRPVINVSWEDATCYAAWLSFMTGAKYRLPSEAEWEYAARAGTETAYWWGTEVGVNHANCRGCGSEWDNRETALVGSFPANPFQLHDTAGNVWEWVQDCYEDNYAGALTDGSAFESKDCARRVVRGGSWDIDPVGLRSANRTRDDPDYRGNFVGFRLAQDLP